ncbi:hypothetical protein D3C86_2161910 [compost metagenome]
MQPGLGHRQALVDQLKQMLHPRRIGIRDLQAIGKGEAIRQVLIEVVGQVIPGG